MRRVVITGIGIVSSIGNSAAEVEASLRAGKSGIVAAPDYAEHGFRCRVHGQPNIVLEDHIDKRDLRFMGDGAAYTFIAMDQAVKDSGLAPEDVSNERTGIIVGSGGPSTKAFFKAHNIVRETGCAKTDRPVRRDQGHVLDRVGLPCDAVQDQGCELFDHLGLLHQRALHRQRHRADPDGQAGHRLCWRG
jgi:3-oxoacyl-(acyl-carrier-protein) synthase